VAGLGRRRLRRFYTNFSQWPQAVGMTRLQDPDVRLSSAVDLAAVAFAGNVARKGTVLSNSVAFALGLLT